jgi:hypothetical protein
MVTTKKNGSREEESPLRCNSLGVGYPTVTVSVIALPDAAGTVQYLRAGPPRCFDGQRFQAGSRWTYRSAVLHFFSSIFFFFFFFNFLNRVEEILHRLSPARHQQA